MFNKAVKPKKSKPRQSVSEAILAVAHLPLLGLFIITFIVQAFEIPSRSMENTLQVGDHLFVDRLTAAPRFGYLGPLLPYRPIRRGEVAVFISPAQPGLHLIKRIVGVPGDKIHLLNGDLYVNGVKQVEPYVYHAPDAFSGGNDYRDNFPNANSYGSAALPEWPTIMRQHMQGSDVVVPGHSYFAMGDSRDNSYDSRYWGFVPEQNIIGRPLFIYWSAHWSRLFHPVR